MTIRYIHCVILAMCLRCNAPAQAADEERPRDERPNILFIFTDDHAAHAISAYGSAIATTPNIDRIAREGVLFRNCFATNAICAPSRAVILSGRHSHLNGVMTNAEAFNGEQTTFPKLLQRVGYETAMLGKWHLKSDPTGFDYWRVLIGQGPYYNPPMKTPEGRKKYTGYTTDIITDLALEWLESGRDEDKPFLMMCQHKAPHRNWQPGPEHLTLFNDIDIPEPDTLFDDYEGRASGARNQEMTLANHFFPFDVKLETPGNLTDEQLAAWNAAYEPKNEAYHKAELKGDDLVRWRYQRYLKDYLRTIASVDDNIGRILDYLDESGLAENTIVVYSSDQGFFLGDHGWYDKRWMYEESARMPLIVRWPRGIASSSERSELVQNLDFAPTFLDLAGAEAPPQMQGLSMKPLLTGQGSSEWRDSIYYHYYEFPGVHAVPRHNGVRTDRYKLIHYYQLNEWELFDLEKDPDELTSVYDDPIYATTVDELKVELKRLQGKYADPEPEASVSSQLQRIAKVRAATVPMELAFHEMTSDSRMNANIDPTMKPFAVGAWCTPSGNDGVIAAQGGGTYGYVLSIRDGKPLFGVRDRREYREVRTDISLPDSEPVHLAGVLLAAR